MRVYGELHAQWITVQGQEIYLNEKPSVAQKFLIESDVCI